MSGFGPALCQPIFIASQRISRLHHSVASAEVGVASVGSVPRYSGATRNRNGCASGKSRRNRGSRSDRRACHSRVARSYTHSITE